jgi:hypothetical protein
MWSLKLGLLSLRFLLGDMLWFGLAHPIEFRLHLVSLRLSGVGAFFYVDFKTMNTASGGMDACRAGRGGEVLLRAKVNIEGVNDFDPLVWHF